MFFPKLPPELELFFFRNSLEYNKGYEDGYEECKNNFIEALKTIEEARMTTSTETVKLENNS